jgi:hypothetical protein
MLSVLWYTACKIITVASLFGAQQARERKSQKSAGNLTNGRQETEHVRDARYPSPNGEDGSRTFESN